MTERAQTLQPVRLRWQEARVEAIVERTPTVKSFFLRPADWSGFRAGQHVDIRLTAPDGYQAQRSYSIASAPEDGETIELAIEKLDDGEVSPFFHDVVETSDLIELRGPIGGHFNWSAGDGGPILLVAGGSGLAPLMAMLRHRAAAAPDVPAALVYSARSFEDTIWREELLARAAAEPAFHLLLTLSRENRAGFRSGRIDAGLVAEALGLLPAQPKLSYVCGSTPFVEAAAKLLLGAGLPFGSIRTERYGGG